MKIRTLNRENISALLELMQKRKPSSFPKQEKAVAEILDAVRKDGDKALFAYTRQFDHAELDAGSVLVSEEEIREAYDAVGEEFLRVLRAAAARIRAFHEKQKEKSWFETEKNGSLLGQRVIPLQKVGLYAPGGTAAYPSSVLMNVLPAQIAGVPEIILCTPCGPDGKAAAPTVVAAHEAGVGKIFKIGGAQAIAAMAFGTESVPKVDKITGPGNIYVALAKKAVYGYVSIDSVAGPSEILVLADETANPRYVAADLLSQAEHDVLASAVCVTTSMELAEKIAEEAEAFIPQLARKEIIRQSVDNYGVILVAENMDEAIAAVNEIASEHLEILTADPFAVMPKILHAGAIFLGEYASEPLGDYFAGPNHVLPTCGTARFFSALSVQDFVKKSSVIYFTEDALRSLHKDIETFAKAEGLTAHAGSIAVRFEKEEGRK